MSNPLWQQYLAAGHELATHPDLFPFVVAFLDTIVAGNEARELVLSFFEWQLARWTPEQLADALCKAEPALAELESELDAAVERLSIAERQVAGRWALFTMRGHEQTLPTCVGELLSMLHDPPEPTA